MEGAGADAQSWHLARWLGLVSSLAPYSALGQVLQPLLLLRWWLWKWLGFGSDELALPLVLWFGFEKLWKERRVAELLLSKQGHIEK